MAKQVAILVTGNEIIKGYSLDTNSNHYAINLTTNCVKVGEIIKVGDNKKQITDNIASLLQKYDCIIISGGLGPTSDDITRFALATYLGQELIEDQESWNHITNRMKKFQYEIDNSNKQQALFPLGAEIFINNHGTANGCYLQDNNGKDIFMIPGPPSEAIPMFHKDVLPKILSRNYKEPIFVKQWRLIGVAESQIAPKLDEIAKDYNIETAFCVKYPYLDFMITMPKFHEEAVNRFDEFLKDIFVSNNFYTASQLLCNYIADNDLKFLIQDDASGGILLAKLTTPRTRNKLVMHDADISIKLLGLAGYWNSNTITTMDSFSIEISYKDQALKIERSHPLRGDEIKEYTSEHTCFYILKFLKDII